MVDCFFLHSSLQNPGNVQRCKVKSDQLYRCARPPNWILKQYLQTSGMRLQCVPVMLQCRQKSPACGDPLGVLGLTLVFSRARGRCSFAPAFQLRAFISHGLYRVDMMRDVHATDEGIAASKANALLRGSQMLLNEVG